MKSFPKFEKVCLIICTSIAISSLFATKAFANVRCIQSFLSETVFDPGPVDGAWGKKTATALQDYASYHQLKLKTKIDRKNAESLCTELTSLELKSKEPSVRRFKVNITLKDLEEFTGRKQIDLSQISVLDELNYSDCRFTISRQQIETKRIESLAAGRFNIESGLIKFGENSWYTGGLADGSYLIDQGVLAFSDDFKLNGSIPYFHLFVSTGEIAERPLQIDFSESKEDETWAKSRKNKYWPKVYKFDVDHWQTGMIKLRCSGN
jgi:hypothetical protein